MINLNQQHCFHHQGREAVVRCPGCKRFFCRECVTEHDDRMLCSECLNVVSKDTGLLRVHWYARIVPALQGVLGFLIIWYMFVLVGKMLLAIPHDFHEGTIWQADWWFKK